MQNEDTHKKQRGNTTLYIYMYRRAGGRGDSHKNKREGEVAKTLFLCGLAMSDRFARVFVVLFLPFKIFF